MSLLRKRRGVSGIISGVFLVAVAVMIFNVLAWQFFQADAYNRLQQERQQREWERSNERLIVYLPESGISKLNFTVRNAGAVSAHIVDLFFVFKNGTSLYYPLDIWIAPGRTKIIADVGPKLITTDVYFFQIGTERGNVFAPIPTGSGGISNEPKPGQGQAMPFVFPFGYNDFQFSTNNVTWQPAWTQMQSGTYPYFKIYLNNTYSKNVIVKVDDTRISLYPDLDFMSEVVAKTKIDWYIAANSGRWIFYDKTGSKLPGAFKSHLFVFLQVFYCFADKQTEIYGTTVAVLAVYLSS